MKNKIVYVVWKLTVGAKKAWKIQGVFTKENDAVKACTTNNHFVGIMELNKNYKANQKWKGAYFPKLESKPKK